jgi:four helix bundle protein
MKLSSYKDLIVWQKSIELVRRLYILCNQLPRSEQYGLISQMQRSSVSIPSNIAEGYERKSTTEYLRFLSIAQASTAELETQIIITKLVHNISDSQLESLIFEVQMMLSTIRRKLGPSS